MELDLGAIATHCLTGDSKDSAGVFHPIALGEDGGRGAYSGDGASRDSESVVRSQRPPLTHDS